MNVELERIVEESGLTIGEIAEAIRQYKENQERPRTEIPEGQLAFAGVM